MNTNEIMEQLKKIGVAIIATSDEDGQPHARPIHIGVADETGVYFMTSPETNFYAQLQQNNKVAITAHSVEDYLIQVIRIEGVVEPVSRDRLTELLGTNPYVEQVYPDADARDHMQVFHCHQGAGFYHSLTQGHKYIFEF